MELRVIIINKKIELKQMSNYERIKIGIMIVFVAGSLYCFNDYRKNGEYVFHDRAAYIILNTRTGEVIDLRNGKPAFDLNKPFKIVE